MSCSSVIAEAAARRDLVPHDDEDERAALAPACVDVGDARDARRSRRRRAAAAGTRSGSPAHMRRGSGTGGRKPPRRAWPSGPISLWRSAAGSRANARAAAARRRSRAPGRRGRASPTSLSPAQASRCLRPRRRARASRCKRQECCSSVDRRPAGTTAVSKCGNAAFDFVEGTDAPGGDLIISANRAAPTRHCDRGRQPYPISPKATLLNGDKL